MRRILPFAVICILLAASWLAAQQNNIVRPIEIDDVLTNPGIGFMTFQRFNGDTLNPGAGWTEGYPVEYQEFDGDLTNIDHPATSLAYWRVYWRYVHPAPDSIDWHPDRQGDRNRGIARPDRNPAGSPRMAASDDVPDWYREMVGPEEKELQNRKWRTDPEQSALPQTFRRPDQAPWAGATTVTRRWRRWTSRLSGYWGEGSGSHRGKHLFQWQQLNLCYLDGFKKTHLIWQPLNGDSPDPGILVARPADRRELARWPQQRRGPAA